MVDVELDERVTTLEESDDGDSQNGREIDLYFKILHL